MIGTLTFHWATNYGAVLQAYALQKFLNENGYDTEIINYIPLRVNVLQTLSVMMRCDWRFVIKTSQIKKFRNKEMKISKCKYYNNRKLKNMKTKYKIMICGSDQIWNESFTNEAEGKPTLSYYLNFCDDNVRKISYAVSFGTEKLSEKTKKLITPEIQRFQYLSVREEGGKKILNSLGFDSKVVLDPTLLLDKTEYEQLLKKSIHCKKEKCFSYILHKNQKHAIEISRVVKQYYGEKHKGNYFNLHIGIYEWLYKIKHAECVVTNSFHGVVFSIIFQKKFIAIPVEGTGMNDRIYSLLTKIGLEDRILLRFDETQLTKLITQEIDWKAVTEKLNIFRKCSEKFLIDAINGD